MCKLCTFWAKKSTHRNVLEGALNLTVRIGYALSGWEAPLFGSQAFPKLQSFRILGFASPDSPGVALIGEVADYI